MKAMEFEPIGGARKRSETASSYQNDDEAERNVKSQDIVRKETDAWGT